MMKTIRISPFSRWSWVHLRVLCALTIFVFSGACGANENILRSGKETPEPVNSVAVLTAFEQDLKAMQTARFKFIFVLRRRDGEKLDAEDRGVIKINTSLVNRRVATDNGRAFLIGSNFAPETKSMKALNDRFAVDDLSPEHVETNSISNANSNK